MRELKFRGKRKSTGEWIVGNLFIPEKFVGGVYICPECTHADFMPGFEDGDDIEDFRDAGSSFGHFHEVEPETVGQFTGLLDKNGKEIYEGDVIGRKGFINKIIRHNGVNFEHYFESNNFEIIPLNKFSFDECDEVIGNVHEKTPVKNGH